LSAASTFTLAGVHHPSIFYFRKVANQGHFDFLQLGEVKGRNAMMQHSSAVVAG
jgi:hypothetical protein